MVERQGFGAQGDLTAVLVTFALSPTIQNCDHSGRTAQTEYLQALNGQDDRAPSEIDQLQLNGAAASRLVVRHPADQLVGS